MTKGGKNDNIKYLSLGYIISFVASFMIYIYEPILTYSTNIDDFWFDFSLMLPNIIIYFLLMFVGLSLLYTIIYVVANKILKKENIYNVILIITWIIFIFSYIQGNYLIRDLPVLDGTTINWNEFFGQNVISVVILIVLVIIELLAIKKFSMNKTIKINLYITISVFAMLMVSFITVLCTPSIFKDKTMATSTIKNINKASTDKNFFIFLVDAVDSGEFDSVLKESKEYNQTFKDFTYFPDTISAYTFTRDSIPYILSGKWNKNEKEFTEYFNDALETSEFLQILNREGYNINFYENENFCNEKNANIFDNVVVEEKKINKKSFFRQLTKYLVFKYLPYELKRYSKIEDLDFSLCKNSTVTNYNWTNIIQYNIIKDLGVDLEKNKYFKLIHVEGGHVPFNSDENMNEIPEDSGTYRMKLKATLKLVNEFIENLKQNNVYDNSVIMVMADHGYEEKTGRQNPILYIKGVNEHHKMITSELPVSYVDLLDAYKQLLNDEPSTNLFQNVDKERTRKFIDNFFKKEDNMKEYEVKGHSWVDYELIETGVEYNR